MKRSLQINPDNQPATLEDIRDWRNAHEISPIATSFGVFDADEKAAARMSRAIRNWASLQTLDTDGKLHWKLAANELLPLTKAELEQVHAEIDTGVTARASVLHYKAAVFSQMPEKPLLRDIKDINFWLAEQ